MGAQENPRTASSTDPELGGPGQWDRVPAVSPQPPLCPNFRVTCLDRVSRSQTSQNPVSSRGGTRAPGPQTSASASGEEAAWAPLASHAQPTGAVRVSCLCPGPAVFLQVFDNEEFDCRTPIEWINMGLEPGSQHRKPVPGKALLPTDDFLGHGEQGQRGAGRIGSWSAPSCPGSNPAMDSSAVLGLNGGRWWPHILGPPSQLGYRPAGWPHRRKGRGPGMTWIGGLGRGQLGGVLKRSL